MMLKVALLLLLPAMCQGFWWSRDQSDWNGLKVTWGINPFTSFNNMPRTVSDAVSDGWSRMAPGVACDGNAKFMGYRYWKDNDLSVILIFDANNFIAGIQAGFLNTPNPNNYPTNKLINKPLVRDGRNYFITAYFIDPATVCTGRSAAQFRSQGTGAGLWIQNGTNPVTDAQKMPMTVAEADASMWTQGACFRTMGLHYWYNLRADMPCDEFYPVFLMYNDGVLNSFGWAFGMDISPQGEFEHPLESTYGYFMNDPPTCLRTAGTMTTLHIYLTNSALANRC